MRSKKEEEVVFHQDEEVDEEYLAKVSTSLSFHVNNIITSSDREILEVSVDAIRALTKNFKYYFGYDMMFFDGSKQRMALKEGKTIIRLILCSKEDPWAKVRKKLEEFDMLKELRRKL